MEGWITVKDQGGKNINIQVEKITHYYDHYIWVEGGVTIETQLLAGQIAMMIDKPKTAVASEPKGAFDGIVKDHLDLEKP